VERLTESSEGLTTKTEEPSDAASERICQNSQCIIAAEGSEKQNNEVKLNVRLYI
jgi:hypothetical protein